MVNVGHDQVVAVVFVTDGDVAAVQGVALRHNLGSRRPFSSESTAVSGEHCQEWCYC